jgi:hypothetical protein
MVYNQSRDSGQLFMDPCQETSNDSGLLGMYVKCARIAQPSEILPARPGAIPHGRLPYVNKTGAGWRSQSQVPHALSAPVVSCILEVAQ